MATGFYCILIPIFYQKKHYNYAKEGFHLLLQSVILSERKITELKWSRTVNVYGCQGCNIPIDLFMEHMNRRLKFMMGNLHSNATAMTIQRIAKSLDVVKQVCQTFQKETEVSENKGHVSYPSFEDQNFEATKEKVFVMQESGRCLESFNTASDNALR